MPTSHIQPFQMSEISSPYALFTCANQSPPNGRRFAQISDLLNYKQIQTSIDVLSLFTASLARVSARSSSPSEFATLPCFSFTLICSVSRPLSQNCHFNNLLIFSIQLFYFLFLPAFYLLFEIFCNLNANLQVA